MYLYWAQLVAVLWFVVSSASFGIDRVEYERIRDISLFVANKPNVFVIGVGRSPTPFIAFLQEYRPNSAVNLPLSQFRYPTGTELSHEDERKLYQHLDRFIPSEQELEGKEIVLLDYAVSGESLLSFTRYFQKYLSNRNRHNTITPVALVKDTYRILPVMQKGQQHDISIRIIKMGPHEVGRNLDVERYDSLSEYGSFNVRNDDSSRLKKNGAYMSLKQEIRGYIQSDDELRHSCPALLNRVTEGHLVHGSQ